MLGAPAVLPTRLQQSVLGTAVNMGSSQKAPFEDTGLKSNIYPKPLTKSKTILTQPNSFDIVDPEYFSMPKLVPSGSLLGMDTKRIEGVTMW